MEDFDIAEYKRYRDIFHGVRMPFAFVDLEKFDRNIAYVASTQAGTGKSIRIHSKSLRCVDLIRRIFEKGGRSYRGLMTFSLEETAHLADLGFDDFIVAYPTVQPSDIEQLIRLTTSGKLVSLMVDSREHLETLSAAGKRSGTVLRACLDLDLAYRPLKSSLHLGLRRSPIRTVDDAMALALVSRNLEGVLIDAVMGYEGHIAGPNDNRPGKWLTNRIIRILKQASIREFTPRRLDIVKTLEQHGIRLRAVNGGGSGSLISTGNDPAATEVTAGSAFYAPGLFHHFKEVQFVPAAFFAIQVVRRPTPGIITCQGGGYVASGPAGADKLPVPVYPPGLKLLPLEGAGEVQTPLALPPDCVELQLGDPVFLQHAKGGELAERFNTIYLIDGSRIAGVVQTYRGEGKAFL